MKNPISQFALVIIAFVALTFLMSYTRPAAASEAKEYTVVRVADSQDKFIKQVNQNIQEGWKPQGGFSISGGVYAQGMIK